MCRYVSLFSYTTSPIITLASCSVELWLHEKYVMGKFSKKSNYILLSFTLSNKLRAPNSIDFHQNIISRYYSHPVFAPRQDNFPFTKTSLSKEKLYFIILCFFLTEINQKFIKYFQLLYEINRLSRFHTLFLYRQACQKSYTATESTPTE